MRNEARLEDLLPPDGLAAVDRLGPLEILVGIPALNNARSIAQVVEAAARGLDRYASSRKVAVLVADAGSQDGTGDAAQGVEGASGVGPMVQCLRLAGPPHEGRAIVAIMAVARRLAVPACAVVGADLTSMTPDWVGRLVDPLLRDEAEYVSPAYTREVTEGTLTTNLLAPMIGALYGKRVQQVIGSAAGLSGALITRILDDNPWEGDLAAHSIEVRLTVAALASSRRVVESRLGEKQVAPGSGPRDLATTLASVVGPVFSLMERYHAVWDEVRVTAAVERRGEPSGFRAATADPHVERMVRAFRIGLKDLLPVWEQIMVDATLAELYPLGLLAPEEFRFTPGLWARVVYDFAVAHHERRLPRDHLLRALTPLYLGRVAGFVLEVQGGSPVQAGRVLEALAQAFEANKDALRARWR